MTAACAYVSMEDQTTPVGSGYCPPSVNTYAAQTGMLEHRAHVFNGVYDDVIFIGSYTHGSFHYNPASDSVSTDEGSAGTYPLSEGIDFATAPAGVHMVSQYDDQNDSDKIKLSNYVFNLPDDPVVALNGNPSVYDIHPNKAASTQTNPNTFVLGGENFHHLPGTVDPRLLNITLKQDHCTSPMSHMFERTPLGS